MFEPQLSDIYKKDLLTKLQLNPVWEQLRAYVVTGSFVCALFPIYMTLGVPALDCVPYNSTTSQVLPFNSEESQLTDQQMRFVNEMCGVTRSVTAVTACGGSMLFLVVLNLICSSYWLYREDVNKTLQTFARYRDKFIKEALIKEEHDLKKKVKYSLRNTVPIAGGDQSPEKSRARDEPSPPNIVGGSLENIAQDAGQKQFHEQSRASDEPSPPNIVGGSLKNIAQDAGKKQFREQADIENEEKLKVIIEETVKNTEQGAELVARMYIWRCYLLLPLAIGTFVTSALQMYYIYQIEDPNSCEFDIENGVMPSNIAFICKIKLKRVILIFLYSFTVLMFLLFFVVLYGTVKSFRAFSRAKAVMLLVCFLENCNLIDSMDFTERVKNYVRNRGNCKQAPQTPNP